MILDLNQQNRVEHIHPDRTLYKVAKKKKANSFTIKLLAQISFLTVPITALSTFLWMHWLEL